MASIFDKPKRAFGRDMASNSDKPRPIPKAPLGVTYRVANRCCGQRSRFREWWRTRADLRSSSGGRYQSVMTLVVYFSCISYNRLASPQSAILR